MTNIFLFVHESVGNSPPKKLSESKYCQILNLCEMCNSMEDNNIGDETLKKLISKKLEISRTQ